MPENNLSQNPIALWLSQITYSGPNYIEILKRLKKENPLAYNRLLEVSARSLQIHSEVPVYRDAEGSLKSSINMASGFVSGADPVGVAVVEGAVAGKPVDLLMGKILKSIPLNIIARLRHPTYTKIYHGSKSKFDLRKGRPYSKTDVGLHISPNKAMSDEFALNGGYVMEGYIPKYNMETIDLGNNNYNWISNNVKILAKNPSNPMSGWHSLVLPSNRKLLLYEKYGAKPTVEITDLGRAHLYTENTINLPLRNETWKRITSLASKKADDIVRRGNSATSELVTELINKEAALLLSDNGIKVIKYNNDNPYEIGGTAYAVTDPSVIYIPEPLRWRSGSGLIIGTTVGPNTLK